MFEIKNNQAQKLWTDIRGLTIQYSKKKRI